jgi:GAF domain-containing protein
MAATLPQLQALVAASLAVNSESTVEGVFETVNERAREIIGVHQAVTSTIPGIPDLSQVVVALSLSDRYAAYRTYKERPNGTGIYSLICRDNRPMRMTQQELESHPAWRGFGTEVGKHPPMRGWLAAPLVGRDGRNMGLIQLSDKYEGEFTEEDEAVLMLLAQMASLAMENARLLETVGRVAHSFNNLLTVITGFSELLLQRCKAKDPNREILQEMKDAGDKAAALMVQLMVLSKAKL